MYIGINLKTLFKNKFGVYLVILINQYAIFTVTKINFDHFCIRQMKFRLELYYN